MKNPGMLRHKVTIKKRTTTTDGFGQPIDDWVIVATVKASIKPALGNNYYAAEQTQTDAKIKINMRYRTGIKRDMRIYHGDIIYEIIDAIDVDMRHEELVIYCKEVVL